MMKVLFVFPAVQSENSGIGRGRGMAKMGTGRGMNAFTSGRGMAKTGTGRGFAKTGTGRGFAKMGTGRGLAKMGTGRGLARIGGNRGLQRVSPPSPSGANASGEREEFKDYIPPKRGHLVDAGYHGESNSRSENGERIADEALQPDPDTISAVANRRDTGDNEENSVMEPEESLLLEDKTDTKRTLDPVYALDLQSYMEKGAALVERKSYFEASAFFVMAQQVEGFKGPASLKMAGIRIAMGRYYEGINDLRNFLDGGGKITAKGIGLPQDDLLEKRLDEQVRMNPYNGNILTSAILYSVNQSNKEKASRLFGLLQTMNPYHPCLKGLQHAIETLP